MRGIIVRINIGLQSLSGFVISLFLLAACVNPVSTEPVGACGIDVSETLHAKEIDLVGDLRPSRAPMVSLKYAPKHNAMFAIANGGRCVRRINMTSDKVSQYPKLVGIIAAIDLNDRARDNFRSFIEAQYDLCERDEKSYFANLSRQYPSSSQRAPRSKGGASTYDEQKSACGQMIDGNSYVANVKDGDDMVTIDVFGELIFVARRKWQ